MYFQAWRTEGRAPEVERAKAVSTQELRQLVGHITPAGRLWLNKKDRSEVWKPSVDADALEAMRTFRQDSMTDAQVGAAQLEADACVGYVNPVPLKALRYFIPGLPNDRSYLNERGFYCAAELLMHSPNVQPGDGVFFFDCVLASALGIGPGHKCWTVDRMLNIATSAIDRMHGVVCGDGGDGNLFRRCTPDDFGVWVIPLFDENHANAVFVDFRSKVVFFSCTLRRGGADLLQRVLAFVDLVMHAIRDSWTWDG